MKITVLDAKTLGDDLSLEPLMELGECEIYPSTEKEDVASRIKDCDVVVLNKVKLDETNLCGAKNLKLICVAATGYDNIDVNYCKIHNIGVCNVVGYSSHSVALVTVSTVLSLFAHLGEYSSFVKNGEYTESGVANRLTPVYHELYGKTWGIIGFGNIGKEVGQVAKAFGCKVLVNKRTPMENYNCVDLDTLCKESDIITIHTPLNQFTKGLVGRDQLQAMKKDVVLVNEARGAVTDEEEVAKAISNGEIGAFGSDVYSVEPFGKDHPFYRIKDMSNVLLTPHMAWGAYEARVRCLGEIVENIKAFYNGTIRNRLDV